MSHVTSLVIALALVANARSVSAETHAERAERLWRQGKALVANDHVDEACDSFQASLDLDAQIGTMLNLADCRAKQERFIEAYSLFEQAAKEADRTDKHGRAAFARQQMELLEPGVAAERAALARTELFDDNDDARIVVADKPAPMPPKTTPRKSRTRLPSALMIGGGAFVLGGIALIVAAKQQHAMAYAMRDAVAVRQSQMFADIGAGLAAAGAVAAVVGFVWHIEADDDHVAISASTTF
jgi:tetratricopeptide (TPR) repeat protein